MKIAVISGSEHYKIGGVETFLRNLLRVFIEEKIDFDEVVIRPKNIREKQKNVSSPIHTKKIVEIGGSFEWAPRKPIKTIEKWIRDNKYDLYIINVALYGVSRKILKSKKVIYVQHGNFKNNSWSGQKLSDKIHLFFNAIFGMSILGNPYNDAQNVVYFTKENDKSTNPNINKYYSNLCSPILPFISKYKRSGSIWLGRLAFFKKGLDLLDEVLKDSKIECEIFGSGRIEDINKAKSTFGEKFHGPINANEVQSLLQKKKVMILTSRYEGFPLVISEALSSGMAVVCFRTFDSVKWFENCSSVFAFDVKNINGFRNKVEELQGLSDDEFELISRNSINFAKETLTYDKFKNRWINIINDMKNKKA